MNDVELTYAGALYDRTRALYDRDVGVEGAAFRYVRAGIEELFWRQGRYGEFDAAEFSFGAYLASAEAPDRLFDAIPVFPSRAFRHSALFVRADSDITTVADLTGARIGTPEWSQTASLWMRGILAEHHGLDIESVRWRTGGLEEAGRQEKSRVRPPDRFSVEPSADGHTLSGDLLDGNLDALLSARPPRAFLRGDPRVRRLFPDYRSEELRYFQATGVAPIMHVVVVRRELLAHHPWIANNLRLAFERARIWALPELRDPAVCTTSLVWESAYAEEEAAALGDVFAYGVGPNQAALSAILRYAHEQGFTSRLLEPADIFVPTTLTDAKV